MHQSSSDTLVRMANQISKFFAIQGEARAVPGIAEHIKKFWEPRMKAQMFAHLEAGGAGLEPYALKAMELLRHAGATATTSVAAPDSVADAAVKTEPLNDPKKSPAGQEAQAARPPAKKSGKANGKKR